MPITSSSLLQLLDRSAADEATKKRKRRVDMDSAMAGKREDVEEIMSGCQNGLWMVKDEEKGELGCVLIKIKTINFKFSPLSSW